LLAEVARALDALGVEQARVLVAVSGGVDSTVLAHALATLAPERGLDLAFAHVNHGLRGDASRADAQAVEELAARMGVAFHVRHVVPD
jgi:tRNA(Ile)-lysidine synthase TilS/MesJ